MGNKAFHEITSSSLAMTASEMYYKAVGCSCDEYLQKTDNLPQCPNKYLTADDAEEVSYY